MPTNFSPARALGIPRKDYADYFPGSSRSFNPDRGYSAQGSMVTPVDAYAQQFDAYQTNRALENLQAEQDLLATDPRELMTQDGRAQRLDYMLRGVLDPRQNYEIERMMRPAPVQRPPSINKYSPVPADVVRATAELDYIDPTDPDAFKKRNEILRSLDSSEEYGPSNVKAHPHFLSKDQNLMRNILTARRDREVRENALRKDETKMETKTAEKTEKKQEEQAKLSTLEVQQMDKAAEFLVPDSPPEERAALAMIVRDLVAAGRAVPPRYIEMAGLAQSATPQGTAPVPSAGQDIPMVNSIAELKALGLPPGSEFRTPDGKVRKVN
jgi:hypothetical protein